MTRHPGKRGGHGRLPALLPAALAAAALLVLPARPLSAQGMKGYVGSDACKGCHEEVYNEWKKTSHARMLRNAYKEPDAIEATDFGPQIPFKKNDIFFTIGSHWIQKYMTLMGGQFYQLPKYWNIPEAKWEPYTIFNWKEEPYPMYCNGCHVAGFDPTTRSYAEEGIVCESCHGPGQKHADSGDPKHIVDPAKLDKTRRDMICEQCHTDGKDKATQTFPFPAGYKAGDDLTEYYTDFFMPKPKSKGWYWGDMSYKERHRMFMFYQTKFYATDRACEVCGFDRGLGQSSKESGKFMSRSQYCGTCHRKQYPRYPDHAFHTEQQAACVDCHVPTVTRDGQRYSIHDHKFDFSQPLLTCDECHNGDVGGKTAPASHKSFNINEVSIKQNLTLSQACLRCHKDKDEAWTKKGIDHIRIKGFKTKPT